jgi:hypothetical protein
VDTTFRIKAFGESVEIVENRALLLKVRDADRITNVIPKSKIIASHQDHHEVLVHWGLEEVRVLKNLGVKDTPSPILKDYDWKGIYKPLITKKQPLLF